MLSDQDYKELAEDLFSKDLNKRAIALQGIINHPTQNNSVLNLLRGLIDDSTPCLIAIPYLIGEIRYLAVKALRKELMAKGITEGVCISVTKPVTTDELRELERRYDIVTQGGMEGRFKCFKIAREMGRLPLIEISY